MQKKKQIEMNSPDFQKDEIITLQIQLIKILLQRTFCDNFIGRTKMNTSQEQILITKNLNQNNEITISYKDENDSIQIINRIYIRYMYSKYKPNHLFVIAKEKTGNLKSGTLCTINSLSLSEINFRAKLFRICDLNFERACADLINLYQYDSPETSFEIFEAIDITVI